MVYWEVPGEASPRTVLALSRLMIAGEEKSVSLTPDILRLDSAELMGRQVLLADTEVPAGLYDRLILVLSEATTTVGSAEVAPDIQGEGYELAINTEIVGGDCRAVFVRWRPSLESGRAQPYVPFLEVIGDRVPPLGARALVTCQDTGCLVVFDRATSRVVNMVRLGVDPRGIVYERNQQKIFVAMAGEDALAVIDGLTLRVERKLPARFGDKPERLALSAGLDHLYVLNPGSRTLSVLGTWSLQEQFRVTLGQDPSSLAVDPESGYVYVACEGEGQIQIIDPAAGSLVSVLTPTAAPREVIFDEFNRQLFVGSASQNRIFFYGLLDSGTVGSHTICGHAEGLVYNPQTQQVFAALPGCREVAVVRPALGLEFAGIQLPAAPSRLAFDADFSQLFVLFAEEGAMAVCSPQRGDVGEMIRVGGRPYGVVAP